MLSIPVNQNEKQNTTKKFKIVREYSKAVILFRNRFFTLKRLSKHEKNTTKILLYHYTMKLLWYYHTINKHFKNINKKISITFSLRNYLNFERANNIDLVLVIN